ncbi:MAG TPA: heme-binding protein [Nitrospiraceae bacterium]|nr:heme-binding protein [Nitrospiraceae bacterium]
MKRTMALITGMAVLGTAAFVQAESVAEKRGLTLEGAKKVVAATVTEAKRVNAPGGSIAVVDDGGNLLAMERLDQTFAASANIAIGKARTSALFKKPTKVFEDAIKGGRTSMVTLSGDLQNFTPLQGGIPLEWEGKVVGAIGVSGAASAQQDEELAIIGAQSLDNMEMAGMADGHAPLPVTYIESRKVSASFAKGAVLVGEDENMMHAGRNYMVHASHRDKPGVVEIHELDTDIVYVLKGSAQLITGGTPVGAKTIAPHELRAPTVNGGEARNLVSGDVVIIPNGVAHWFKEVEAPFDYYVVKVR